MRCSKGKRTRVLEKRRHERSEYAQNPARSGKEVPEMPQRARLAFKHGQLADLQMEAPASMSQGI